MHTGHRSTLIAMTLTLLAPAAVLAQHAGMDHSAHAAMMGDSSQRSGTQSGQSAFAAIAEAVRILEADSTTDWSRVDVERLRQHLIDMDEVVMHSRVSQRAIAGGMEADVTGDGRTAEAIRHMLVAHAAELNRMPDFVASTREIASGVRLVVTARNADDARTAARIRALGPIGLLTEGEHHAMHHLMILRGAMH
jgi:hypothetical protein